MFHALQKKKNIYIFLSIFVLQYKYLNILKLRYSTFTWDANWIYEVLFSETKLNLPFMLNTRTNICQCGEWKLIFLLN